MGLVANGLRTYHLPGKRKEYLQQCGGLSVSELELEPDGLAIVFENEKCSAQKLLEAYNTVANSKLAPLPHTPLVAASSGLKYPPCTAIKAVHYKVCNTCYYSLSRMKAAANTCV